MPEVQDSSVPVGQVETPVVHEVAEPVVAAGTLTVSTVAGTSLPVADSNCCADLVNEEESNVDNSTKETTAFIPATSGDVDIPNAASSDGVYIPSASDGMDRLNVSEATLNVNTIVSDMATVAEVDHIIIEIVPNVQTNTVLVEPVSTQPVDLVISKETRTVALVNSKEAQIEPSILMELQETDSDNDSLDAPSPHIITTRSLAEIQRTEKEMMTLSDIASLSKKRKQKNKKGHGRPKNGAPSEGSDEDSL
ncbi:hypothetical protein NE237_029797 [Protea cynaroides]|uniref:Uncharacterized protein n=1 Tax=Protea cynaroides TaxID=273540 RepID=A0A9Q0GSZ8_9MAGN|nr:hypothetical protein NE237_029797 [Protea cynaroides]